MEFKLVSGFWLLLLCLCVSNAKIVYLNGTEVFNGKLKSSNITTISPLKWFNPRNISNHSGLKTVTDAVNRKNDAEEETRVDAEDQRPAGPLATRSTRQLGLFYGQRFLSGLHILALLAGIYLMIFVVEPVAVPQHYLAQHYFGIPWGVERRTHSQLPLQPLNGNHHYQEPNAKVDLESDLLPFASEKSTFEAHSKKNLTNNYSDKDALKYSPYKFLLSNYTQDNTFATASRYSKPLQEDVRPSSAKPDASLWTGSNTTGKKAIYEKGGGQIEFNSFQRTIRSNNTASTEAKQKKFQSVGIVE